MRRPHEQSESGLPADSTGTDSTDSTESTGSSAGSVGHSLGRSLWVFLKEIVIVVSLAVVLSLVAKTWLVQTFWIPSTSMMNTLVRDDRVLVSKLTPQPFSLDRGDVVVFVDPGGWLEGGAPVPTRGDDLGSRVNEALTWVGLLPEDEGNHLIKRVVGLPGDRITCCGADGRLQVNGVPVDEPYIHPGDTPSDVEFDVTVPQGRLWVLGDHRSDSRDSRFQTREGDKAVVGSVPVENVVGRAVAVAWPLNRLTWLGRPADTFAQVPTPGAAPSTPRPTRTP